MDHKGAAVRHTVVLQPGMPSPSHPAAPCGTLRRPLAGDPLALSTKELIARGYPRKRRGRPTWHGVPGHDLIPSWRRKHPSPL
jgi:hypothetical protein